MNSIARRIFALAACAAIAGGAAGCGSENAADNSSAGGETTTAAETAPEGESAPAPSAAPIDIDFEGDGTAKVTVDGTKLTVGGKELFINGVNTPWDKWNDFGSDKFNYAFWDMHFAELEEAGINASRIWINCADMVGVKLDESGKFSEVTDKHWQDLDVLFTIAKKHHIYIMATLMSFDHFKDSNNGYQSWRDMVCSEDNINSFVEGYVVPFVKRYDSCDYLWSIDLMNEPDWVHENAESGKLGWNELGDLFSREAAAIHDNSDILVTIGFGMIKYNSDKYDGNYGSDNFLMNRSGKKSSYLDFYSTHYYYWEKPWFDYPFDKSPTDFGLDGTKPCVIGEVAANDVAESGETLELKYGNVLDNGWNGIMAWTSNGVDACGDMTDIVPAAAKVMEKAPEKVHPLG